MNFIKKLSEYNSKISILKVLMFFYMFIAGNYVSKLYSGQLKDFIINSRLAQHFIGFITVVVLVISGAKVTKPIPIILFSILGYGWFLLTTKLSLGWNLAIIVLIVIGFIYEVYVGNKQQELVGDPNLTAVDRNKIKKKHNTM